MDRGGPLGWTPGQPTAVIDLGEEFAPDPSNASSTALQFPAAYYAIDSEGSKPRGPPKAYVVGLEDRVEKMEALLKRLRPELDLTSELGPPIVRDSWKTDPAPPSASDKDKDRSTSPRAQGSPPTTKAQSPIPLKRTKRENSASSAESFGTDNQWRFHGKSSSFKLISTTRDLMQKHMVENASTSSDGRQSNSPASVQPTSSSKRPQFWTVPPWEKAYEHADDPTVLPDFLLPAFPPEDLAETLIHDYFQYNNLTFPLLHRPTFERQWRDKLYTRNVWFACICVTIFGLASRWSEDPRVLPDEVADKAAAGEEGIWTLAGWKFIAVAMKLHEARRSVLLPPELFEIQSFALISQYFRGTVAQHGSWFYLSVGVLKAQDVGAHRKKIYGRKPTIEEELWKRAYWHLVAFDRIGSMLIGRPCCTREEDLDLELPLEVDDEYWENENPDLVFKQPEGKPSLVTAFIHWIKLSHIIAFALKMLYSVNKSEAAVGRITMQDREKTVDQLTEALSKWLEELPPHLRWKPDIEDRAFATQAATLYTTYHLVQIIAYRPFIHVPHGPSAARPQSARKQARSQKALAICLSSARACGYILDVQMRRGMLNLNNVVHVSFVSAGVLLVHLWDLVRQYGTQRWASAEARAQMSQDISSVMGEIGECMARLEQISAKWELAREILDEIKDALPNTATDESPASSLPSGSGSFAPAYDTASSSEFRPRSYSQQISPLTPPDQYDLHTYQSHPLVQPAPRGHPPSFVDPSLPMQLSLDSSGLPQLWDMDGAPASPPPLPDFAMFMPQQPPPQQFPPNPVHKPSASAPIYTHAQHYPSARHSIPHANATYGHHMSDPMRASMSGYPDMRSQQQQLPRQNQPAYQQQPFDLQQPQTTPSHPQTYGESDPPTLPPEYQPSFLKREEAQYDDRECLRLRLLEEVYRQRAGLRRDSSGNPASSLPDPRPNPYQEWLPGPSRWPQ
ncbi:hypothetical protein BN946_scf184979.g14 [Trametes cinnabarina]|uniref:Xylanolytic transcriptional activator regulatory domain-containing protein n=1 Tax=Pycnoporus cinnabarinus TaxID=5643 RepID=A0A060SQG4_PYCCI|nr:hypothetical protein BN946_scf184979.g14 [Trametes cinnabarina]